MTQQALFALPAYHRGSYCTCASERLGAERPPWDAIVSSAERCVPASRLWRSPDSRSWHFPRRRRRLPGDVPAQAGGAQGDTGRKAAIHVRGVIRRAPSAPCARPGRRRPAPCLAHVCRAAAAGLASQRSCCASPGVPGPRACQALGLAAAPGKRAGLGWAPAPSKPGLAQLRACCCTPSRDWMPRTCSTTQTPGLGDACCWGPARRATGRGLSAQNTRCLLACAPLCAGAAGDPVRGRQGLRGTGPTAWARSASWTRCRP